MSRWGSSFSFSGCSVMSHIGAGLSVSRITTGTECFLKITSVKHNLLKYFSNVQWHKSSFVICSFLQEILRYIKSCFGLWVHQNETWS